MDTENILDQAIKINDKAKNNILSENDISTLMIEYNELYDMYPSIFKMACKGDMNIERLTYMLDMLDKIKNNNITEHDASVNVGQVLVDEIVKPNLEKK